MSLEDARSGCMDARGKARKGQDPRADDPKHSDNFKLAVESYIKHEQIGRHHNKSAAKTKGVMLTNCEPLHAFPVATIRYDQIEKLLWLVRDGDEDKKLRARPYLANRLHSHLKDFFSWGARRGAIKVSPMTDMERPWDGEKPRERDWFKEEAADNAIKALWRSADVIGGNEGKYLKLMILTGKRRSALEHMRWEEIKPDWYWDAPQSDAKNKRLHAIPLPGLAQRLLHPRQSTGKVFGDMNLYRVQTKVKKLTGITDFIYHGVRHLVETKTAELRDEKDRSLIPPNIRDLLLDHAPMRGAGKGYDHHDYKPEMRTAMEEWANYVERLVQPIKDVSVLR